MAEIFKVTPSAFDGEDLYDSSEPRILTARPQECAVDMMELVEGLPVKDARIVLNFCGVNGLNLLNNEGAKVTLECSNDDCGVEMIMENQDGVIIASADPGCADAYPIAS